MHVQRTQSAARSRRPDMPSVSACSACAYLACWPLPVAGCRPPPKRLCPRCFSFPPGRPHSHSGALLFSAPSTESEKSKGYVVGFAQTPATISQSPTPPQSHTFHPILIETHISLPTWHLTPPSLAPIRFALPPPPFAIQNEAAPAI
jgi:hypothetical protein